MKADLLEEGAPAPKFELAGPDGGRVTLDALRRGGPVVLAFYKVSCPVCQMTFPYFERLSKSGGLRFFGIGQDHAGAVKSFETKFGITFPTLLDTEASGYPVSNAYGISHVPTAFLIEPDGAVSWAMEGFSKARMLELAERAALPVFQPGEYVPEWKSG
jgi:peroxiredoxin